MDRPVAAVVEMSPVDAAVPKPAGKCEWVAEPRKPQSQEGELRTMSVRAQESGSDPDWVTGCLSCQLRCAGQVFRRHVWLQSPCSGWAQSRNSVFRINLRRLPRVGLPTPPPPFLPTHDPFHCEAIPLVVL